MKTIDQIAAAIDNTIAARKEQLFSCHDIDHSFLIARQTMIPYRMRILPKGAESGERTSLRGIKEFLRNFPLVF